MAEVNTVPEQRKVRYKVHLPASAALLVAACVFFLWMFFAADGLERLADLGLISAPGGQDPRVTAHAFAAQWRHGMAGNSPLYMPGFYAAAVAIWLWSMDKTLLRILAEGTAVLSIAFGIARMLAPFGIPLVLERYRSLTGCTLSGSVSGPGAIASAQAVYTLLTWSTVLIASRFALKMRSFKPLAVPLLLSIVLAFVRPWTVGDLVSLWLRRSFNADPAAVISLALVPIVAALLYGFELSYERRQTRRAS